MAIRMMVSKERFQTNPAGIEVVTNYRGHSIDMVSHSSGRYEGEYGKMIRVGACPHNENRTYESERTRFVDCPAECVNVEPLYMETTYKGCVLSLREANGYDDSDFFATVWDHAANEPIEIEYGTTRGWTYPNNATVDATDDVKALYSAYREKCRIEAKADHDAELAKMPAIGKRVKIIGGRKVGKGTVAEVVWFGKDTFKETARKRYASGYENILPFKYYADEYRVGIRLNDGTRVFVSANHVELI